MDADLIRQFQELPDAVLAQFDRLHREELGRRKFRDPAAYFPVHRIQSWVLEAPSLTENPVRVILVAGGNRGGKSATGKLMWSQIIRRQSPLNAQLRCLDMDTGEVRPKGDNDPLSIWVVPPTLEKARQDWINPSDGMGLRYWAGDRFLKHEEQPDNVIYTNTPGLKDPWEDGDRLIKTACDKTLIKSQDQSLLTFESSAVDVALVDEEMEDVKKWNSILLRLATNNGVIAMFYTPLRGLTWSFDRYWKPLVKLGKAEKIADRCWMHTPLKGATVICAQMGCADNPLARDYAGEIEADPEMSDAEKSSRLHGEYGFVEGTLIPALAGIDILNPLGSHRQYVVDALPGQRVQGRVVQGRLSDWYLLADPNKSYGAVLGAMDQDQNLFLVAEHLEESWPNRRHAEAFRAMERRHATGPVQRFADTGSAGAQSIVDQSDFGMLFSPMPKGAGSVGASVKRLRGLAWVDPLHVHPITGQLGAPRIYFYRPGMVSTYEDKGRTIRGCRTADQIGQARQTDNRSAPPDTPHKDIRSKLDLFDCVRYMVQVASASPETDEQKRRANRREDHIPHDTLTADEEEGSLHPLDREIYTPIYHFGG